MKRTILAAVIAGATIVTSLASYSSPLGVTASATYYVEYRTGTHQVACSELNVRNSQRNGKVIGTVHKNDLVDIVSLSGNWGQLASGGYICLDYCGYVHSWCALEMNTPSSVTADEYGNAKITFTFKGVGIASLGVTADRQVSGYWSNVSWKSYPNACTATLNLYNLPEGETTKISLRLIGEGNRVIKDKTVKVRYNTNDSVAEQYAANLPDMAEKHIGNNYKAYIENVDAWCGYATRKIAYDTLLESGLPGADAENKIGYSVLACACTVAYWYERNATSYCFMNWEIETYYSGYYGKYITPRGDANTRSTNFMPRGDDFILTETNGWLGDGPDHIGLIVSVSDDGSSFKTIEGNTGSGDASTRTIKYRYYERVKVTVDGKQYYTYRRTDTSGIWCAVTNILHPNLW